MPIVLAANDFLALFGYQGGDMPTGAAWTLGFRDDTGGRTPQDLATELATQYANHLDTFISSSAILTNIKVKQGPMATGPAVDHGVNIPGAGGADQEPPQVSYLVRKNTAIGGRSGRGRAFIPGVVTANVFDNGVIAGAWVTTINTGLAGFRTAMENAGWGLRLFHSSGPLAGQSRVILSLTADTRVATQRRRMRR